MLELDESAESAWLRRVLVVEDVDPSLADAYLALAPGFAVDEVDLEAKLVDRGDWNSDGSEELLLQLESTAEVIPAHGRRTTSGFYLLELEAKRIVERLEVDGGTTPLGTTLDLEETTTSTCQVVCKKKACTLEVKQSTHCPSDKSIGPCTEKEKFVRRAWSAKHGRWQIYSGMAADAYILVAATRALNAAKKRPLQADALKAAAAGWLTLTPGYPRVVASDDFAGLRPGYQLVVLGICRSTKDVRRLYKKMPRRVRRKIKPYSRGILLKKQKLACPALAGGK